MEQSRISEFINLLFKPINWLHSEVDKCLYASERYRSACDDESQLFIKTGPVSSVEEVSHVRVSSEDTYSIFILLAGGFDVCC